jgi:hypothetical protein
MIENIEIIKKEAAVFILESLATHDLIDKTIGYFEAEISGSSVSDDDWGELVNARALALDLDRALALDLDRALDLALALALDRDRALALALDLDRALARALALDLASFLLPKVAKILTSVNLPKFILDQAEWLEMGSWHSENECGTTHCMSGFAEVAHGSAGAYIVKHFGHELGGHILFLHSTGEAVDFHTDNETAIETLKEMEGKS